MYNHQPHDLESAPCSVQKPSSICDSIQAQLLRKVKPLVHRVVPFPHLLNHSTIDSEREEISATSWLDGIRGIAALLVFFYHLSYVFHPRIDMGYASGEGSYSVIQLPFVRLLVAGPAMVAVFFVISGYALSLEPLKIIQDGSPNKALNRVASATFRRPIRLFLPCIISTFTVVLLVSLGVYTKGDRLRNEGNHPGHQEPAPSIFPTFHEQFFNWVQTTAKWISTGGEYKYDCHLWSIPDEFRNSIYLFITIVASANLRTVFRFLVLLCMQLYCHLTGLWTTWLFFAGALLAQVEMLQESSDEIVTRGRSWYRQWQGRGKVAVFVISLYLLSTPVKNVSSTPGYQLLSRLSPEWPDFWRCVGATCLVWSVRHTEDLRSIFSHSICRYLGRISFAMYIVHGPIIHMLGFWLIPWFWTYTRKDTPIRYELGFFLGGAIVAAVVVWTADKFSAFVDRPSRQFAQHLEVLCKA